MINKGNPNHDENGRFTSGSNASHGKTQNPINDKEVKYNADVQQKLAAMGFGPDKENKNVNQSESEKLKTELESGDFVDIVHGFEPSDYGYDAGGLISVGMDALKTPDGKYEVYVYLEGEDGPLDGYEPAYNEPRYVFNSFDELQAFIDNGYKEKEKETKPQDRVEKWHSTPEYIKKRNKLITQLNRGEINMNQYYESLKILDDLFVKRNPPQNVEEAREDFLRASDNWEHHGGSWVEVERTYDEWKKAMKKEGKEPFYKD